MMTMALIISMLVCRYAQAASSAKAAQAEAELPAAIAMLDDFFGKPTLDITFFSEPLTDVDRQKLAALGSNALSSRIFESVSQWPILKVQMWFRENSLSCDFSNLLSFTVVFYKSDGFSFPITNKFAQWAFARSYFSPGDYGVNSLSCQLKPGSTVKLQMRGSKVSTEREAKLAPGVSELPLSWNVDVATVIYAKPAGNEVEQKYAKLNFGMSYPNAAKILGKPGKEIKSYDFMTHRWEFRDGSRLSVDFCDAVRCGGSSLGGKEAVMKRKLIKSGMTVKQVVDLLGLPSSKGTATKRSDYRWDFGEKGTVNATFEQEKLKSFSKAVTIN